MDGPCAIGRIGDGRAWVGFVRVAGEYRLALGEGDAVRTVPADTDLLLCLAIAYFEDALEDPPPAIEATHEDLSELVRDLAARAPDPHRRRLLQESVDAIDDGLAVDAVMSRLTAARGPATEEQADPVDLLLERAEALRAEV